MQSQYSRELKHIIGQKTEEVCYMIENHAKQTATFSYIKPLPANQYNKSISKCQTKTKK